MAEQRSRRRHTARGAVTLPSLGRAGASIRIEVYRDEEKIGELGLGQGSIWWYGRKWKHPKRFSWSKFAQLMSEA
ncbi:MAG: hypothetical protein KatS3mg076_2843 [Candidatus Binatia bacterium]|nr:MAG: hypothetical protein KatS3mg076_2843 [Candidatus Binatia bacterium]